MGFQQKNKPQNGATDSYTTGGLWQREKNGAASRLKKSEQSFSVRSKDVARSVESTKTFSKNASHWTIIIEPDDLEDCCVFTVIAEWLDV